MAAMARGLRTAFRNGLNSSVCTFVQAKNEVEIEVEISGVRERGLVSQAPPARNLVGWVCDPVL